MAEALKFVSAQSQNGTTPSQVQLKATSCSPTHLGDVTPKEWEAYLKVKANATADLIKRWPYPLPELGAEFQAFVMGVRSRCPHYPALLTIATYKKLHPEATSKDLNQVYFVSWMQDWMTALGRTVCNFEKSHKLRVPEQDNKTICVNANYLAMMTSSLLDDMAQEHLGSEKYFADLMRLVRANFRNKLFGLMIDAVKFTKMHDEVWNEKRSQCSSSAFVSSVEVAFCMAQVPMDSSELMTASKKLAAICGSVGRAVNDFADVESDLLDGNISWVFQTAFRKANEDQRRIFMEHSASGTKATAAAVFKIYEVLDITREFELHKEDEVQKFFDVLQDSSSEMVPKKTWKACLQFIQKPNMSDVFY